MSFFFKRKTAYGISTCLEFRRVLCRSGGHTEQLELGFVQTPRALCGCWVVDLLDYQHVRAERRTGWSGSGRSRHLGLVEGTLNSRNLGLCKHSGRCVAVEWGTYWTTSM